MKRHLRLSSTGQEAHEQAGELAAMHATSAATVPRRSHLTLVEARPWSHTLILKGRLDEQSASELEDEIECLREEGVSSLTLDLRQLEAVDAVAMQLIASQQAWFRSCGRRFAVLDRAAVRRGTGGVAVHSFAGQAMSEDWEMSTTMVRELGSA